MNRNAERAFFGLGIIVILAWLAFWGAIIYVAVHFIRRLW